MMVTRIVRPTIFSAGLLMLAVVSAGPAMGALIIDNVNDPAPAIALTSTGVTLHSNATTDVGYSRDTSIVAGAGTFMAATVGGGSVVEVTVLDGGAGGNLLLSYAGLLADLAPNSETTLVIDFFSIDTRTELGGSISVTATADGGSATVPLATSSTPTSVFIPFGAFAPSPNFNGVASLSLDFNFSGALTNLAIDRIYTMGTDGNIPEPASFALVGLAIAGLAGFRRSR